MQNILVADSGSTKTEWLFVNEKGIKTKYFSEGINPYFITRSQIIELVKKTIPKSEIEAISKVLFYSAGCTIIEKIDFVKSTLKKVFKTAEITVKSDVIGSAIALFGETKGVACILGTGSNAVVFDGEKATQTLESFGYLLGDEGSGNYIGKRILYDYLHKVMPLDLCNKFYAKFNISNDAILERLYKQSFPNRFLAEFAVFASDNRGNLYIENILKHSFNQFIEFQLSKLNFDKSDYRVGFVGSIAFYFQDILETLLLEKGYKLEKIIKAPLESLANYHINKI